MSNRDAWLEVEEHPPSVLGWYAVTKCWDPEEGFFPASEYWEPGTEWEGSIFLRSPHTFSNGTSAADWAYDHDIEEAI